ncbi:MAG TPA: hypothetical protein VHW70_04895 [Edaphobacter sp.]|jgi:hypothetical protein|nr:hypothetical protein [Edaphobacter sp.]
MQIVIDIPDEIASKARAEGLAVETYVRRIVEQASEISSARRYEWVRFGTPTKTPAEAAESIRQIASRNTLGGLKIKDLMHEGHKY